MKEAQFFFLSMLMMLPGLVLAQKDTSQTLRFKVQAETGQYKIFPEDNYLFTGHKNRIRISQRGSKRPFNVKISNGTITKVKGDSIFQVEGNEGTSAILSIEETKGGKSKVVMTREYKVVGYPRVQLGGVKCDSSITRILLAGGIMSAVYEELNMKIKVESFKMDILKDSKFIQDSSTNARLTTPMKQYVAKLNNGSIVYFTDIVYKGADGKPKKIPMFRVFLTDEGKDAWIFGM